MKIKSLVPAEVWLIAVSLGGLGFLSQAVANEENSGGLTPLPAGSRTNALQPEGVMEEVVDQLLSPNLEPAKLAGWAERDFTGLIEWFGKGQVPNASREAVRDAIVQAMSTREPAAMLDWMEKALPEAARTELYGPLFRQWAATQPTAAGAKLSRLIEGSKGQSAVWDNLVGQVAVVWGESDPKAALGWLQSLPRGGSQKLALTQLVAKWTTSSPHEAAEWTAQQTDPALFQAVAGQWAEVDPTRAVAWAVGLAPDKGRDHALTRVTSVWAQADPLKVAAWSDQLPEGPAREQMMGQLMSLWTVANPEEAGAWLGRQLPAPSRDFALSAFCDVIVATDPKTAFEQAANISDSILREQRLESAARDWMRKNPGEARSSLDESSLAEELKKQILASP